MKRVRFLLSKPSEYVIEYLLLSEIDELTLIAPPGSIVSTPGRLVGLVIGSKFSLLLWVESPVEMEEEEEVVS